MPTEIDRIHYLLDKFEERSNALNGLSYLADFLSYVYDIRNSDYNDENKRIATNCLLILKKRVSLQINKIVANPKYYTRDFINYWSNVLSEYVDSGLDDGFKMKSWQETISKLKEAARWESMSEKQQEKELLPLLMEIRPLLKDKTRAEIEELIKVIEKPEELGSNDEDEDLI